MAAALCVFGGLAAFGALIISVAAQSALHEIFGGVAWVISAVLFGAAAVTAHVAKLRETLDARAMLLLDALTRVDGRDGTPLISQFIQPSNAAGRRFCYRCGKVGKAEEMRLDVFNSRWYHAECLHKN